MATVTSKNNEPVTGRNGRVTNSSKSRFAAFADSEDHDHEENGGGVMLRDFEDDSHYGSASTPMGTNSNTSSSHGRATEPRKKTSTVSFNKPSTFGRRNTIAPIGGGCQSGYITSADGGASLDASVNNWMSMEPAGNDAKKTSDPVRQIGSFQNKAGAEVTSNIHSQMSSAQSMQFGYPQALNIPMNTNTPAAHGGALQHSHSANMLGHTWGTTPVAYNSASNAYNTPQTSGYGDAWGMGLGANFSYVDSETTPSHMPKKVANHHPMATPHSTSVYGQYNQTEPRNFAPRIGAMPMFMPPPPAFSLGGQTSKRHEELHFPGPDSDPFMSPTPKGADIHGSSQALILPSVPESHQLALISREAFHGPVPAEVRAMRSTQLNELTDGPMGLPTQEVALNSRNFPFIESTTQAVPVGHGVVKIKNIPFGSKRAEIIAFLGRNSKILNDNQEPVHIIMERVSSKTQDCYVEFMTAQDAVRAVDRHRDNIQKGRPARLGERPVEVLLSSQAALMQDLFPLASGVWWDNGKPVIQAPIDGQPWKTFKGFVTEEEMTMLVKHVEIPQRSPYSKECPQRPYECMISTIKKLPWYMADRITLRQRHAIYEATVKLIGLLKQTLQRNHRGQETTLNQQLLKRLVTAAMLCSGFSVVQKDNISVLADMEPERARMFNQPRFAEQWVHLHGVCPKPGVPIDVLEWYIAIIREETTRYIHNKHIIERNEIQRTSNYTSLYFGYIWYEVGLPTGKELDNLSLHAVARRELAVIERAFRRAFPLTSFHEEELN